jgi:hypothetical protein
MIKLIKGTDVGNAFTKVLKMYPGTHIIDAEQVGAGITASFILRYQAPSTCSVDASDNSETYQQTDMSFLSDPEINRKKSAV